MNHKQLLLKIQGCGDSLKVTIVSTHKAWKRAIMATNHLAATLSTLSNKGEEPVWCHTES